MRAAYRPWTREDDRRLLDMRAAGKSPAIIAKELKRTEVAVLRKMRTLSRQMPRAEGEGKIPQKAPPRSFQCPKLDCRTEYFAIAQDVPPAAKPKCLECGTPFLAKVREGFVHYYPSRHIFN
jgi:hypothetical protein